jgi:hypothetical protein
LEDAAPLASSVAMWHIHFAQLRLPTPHMLRSPPSLCCQSGRRRRQVGFGWCGTSGGGCENAWFVCGAGAVCLAYTSSTSPPHTHTRARAHTCTHAPAHSHARTHTPHARRRPQGARHPAVHGAHPARPARRAGPGLEQPLKAQLHRSMHPGACAAWVVGCGRGMQGRLCRTTARMLCMRSPPHSLPPHSCCSLLRRTLPPAPHQASKAGADEALMLDPQGFVATCNSTNFFIVREGEVSAGRAGCVLQGVSSTPRHGTPRHTMSHHTKPHHTTPHHTTPHHTTPHHTTPHHTTPHHTTPHHTTPHRFKRPCRCGCHVAATSCAA